MMVLDMLIRNEDVLLCLRPAELVLTAIDQT
jgi:hypothetical protein